MRGWSRAKGRSRSGRPVSSGRRASAKKLLGNRVRGVPGHGLGILFRVKVPPRTRVLAGGLLLAGLLPNAVRAQDPFQPGLRWRTPADAALPAIPRSATFACSDSLVWTASNGAHVGFDVLAGFETGDVHKLLHADAPPGSTGVLSVAAGEVDEALFALVQVARPDSLHRATMVARYSATAAFGGAAFTPLWRFDSQLRANGPSRMGCSADGARVFVAAWNGPTPEVRVDVLDGASGTSLAHTTLFASAFNELAVAANGTRSALACDRNVWIVDANCAVVHQEFIPLATSALSLTGDGGTCAIGGARVRVLQEQAVGYVQLFEVPGNANEVAARVALSRDGRTLAIGWWNASNGVDVRCEVFDVATRTRLFQIAQTGTVGGLQNFPEVVRATPDGERAAFGCWGDGTSAPDILVWDRATNALVLQADAPGSVFALDLAASGRRVVAGTKSAHANQYGSSGEFRLYDTAESEITLLHQPRVGGTLDLAAHANGASVVVIMVGQRSPFSSTLPGLSGTLLLERVGLFAQRGAADANGRGDLSLPLPNDPLQIGTYRHAQSAFRVNGVWSLGTTVVDALVF